MKKAARTGVMIAVAVLTLAGTVATAQAGPKGPNPAAICRETNNADGYLVSHGGCVSSVATVGIDALMEGAFPSRAAAVANCKAIADYYDGFPFSFYGRVDDDRYLATNINSCVNTLYLFHTNQLEPGPAEG